MTGRLTEYGMTASMSRKAAACWRDRGWLCRHGRDASNLLSPFGRIIGPQPDYPAAEAASGRPSSRRGMYWKSATPGFFQPSINASPVPGPWK